MLTEISYIRNDREIMICRCRGSGSFVEIPDSIDGLPVTSLADHCFAAEASYRLRAEKKDRAWIRTDGRWAGQSDPDGPGAGAGTGTGTSSGTSADTAAGTGPEICAGQIEEIFLPASLRCVGAYAFYGCGRLKRIHFPAGLRELGGGCFVACNHIEELCFTAEDDGRAPMCVKGVISDIPYEVTVVLEDRTGEILGRLVFPGYYEESIENTPARIISIHYEGAGFMYRQCFSQGRLSLQHYDSLFDKACSWELPDTVLKMAVSRVSYPALLQEEDRDRYLTWFRKEEDRLDSYLLREHDERLLSVLMDAGYFTKDSLNHLLEMAGAAGDAAMASLLMEYRHTHFSGKSEKYVF